MANSTNLKARSKGTPSRLQEDLCQPQAIVDKAIVENTMVHIAETEELTISDLPDGDISVPMNLWLENRDSLLSRLGITAVQIGADQDLADIVDNLEDIQVIVLPFVAHVDGRGYSHAHLLRQRYGFSGQIRAIGDVKFDQLGFLTRVGCNAFELPSSENYQTALRAFDEFSEFYQPAADNARLIFSKRRSIH